MDMRKIRQLQAILQANGYRPRQGKGSHQIWTHPAHPQMRLVVCGTGGDDVQHYVETRMRKQINQLRRAS
jgi:predicted RNA binding protein YcfA (HicA-like mRNA interferase family)